VLDGAIEDTTDSLPPRPHPITEFPVFDLPTHIDSIVTGPDGNVWFSDLGTSVWRITVTGELTKFSELGTLSHTRDRVCSC
jgi:streptogramin lyase